MQDSGIDPDDIRLAGDYQLREIKIMGPSYLTKAAHKKQGALFDCYKLIMDDLVSDLKRRVNRNTPFNTKGLRGMSVVGDESNCDVILLNKLRLLNVPLYETLHLNCIDISTGKHNCFDGLTANQTILRVVGQ